MQKPLPGPNVMLPALRLSGSPDLDSHLAYKRREAEWKRLISAEHKKWCLCGSYMNHFISSEEPLRSKSCSGDGGEEPIIDGEEGATSGGDIGDEDIVTLGGGGDG
nr:ORF2 [Torque teno felis virus]